MTAGDAPAVTRQKRPRDRAQQILAAATQLFAERGYHAVGIDEIALSVGITGPAIYKHFAGKEALLVAALEQYMDRMIESYRQAVATAKTPHERLEALVHETVTETVDDRDMLAVVMGEMRHLSQRRAMDRRRREAAELWLQPLLEVRPELTPSQASFIAEGVGGVSMSLFSYRPQLTKSQLQDVLTRMSMAVLRAEPGLPEPADTTFAPAGSSPRSAEAGRSAAKDRPRLASRREAILTEAVSLFRKHGFSGVAVDDIGARAGITGPGVYRHFRSKEELLSAAFTRAAEQLAADVNASIYSASSGYDALQRLVESYTTMALQSPDLLAVYLSALPSLSPERQAAVRRAKRAYREEWVELLRQARPELSEAEARTVAFGAIGVIERFTVFEDSILPLNVARPFLRSMAMDALMAP